MSIKDTRRKGYEEVNEDEKTKSVGTWMRENYERKKRINIKEDNHHVMLMRRKEMVERK